MYSTLPAPAPGYGWVWTGYRWEQRPVMYPVSSVGYGFQGYCQQDVRMTQSLYAQRSPRRMITRPPFNHSRHIALCGKTLLVWAVTGYPIAYLWHRFGPEKAVTTWR